MSLREELAKALVSKIYRPSELNMTPAYEYVDVLLPLIEEEIAHARNEAYEEAKEGIAQNIDEYTDSAYMATCDAIGYARGWFPWSPE